MDVQPILTSIADDIDRGGHWQRSTTPGSLRATGEFCVTITPAYNSHPVSTLRDVLMEIVKRAGLTFESEAVCPGAYDPAAFRAVTTWNDTTPTATVLATLRGTTPEV